MFIIQDVGGVEGMQHAEIEYVDSFQLFISSVQRKCYSQIAFKIKVTMLSADTYTLPRAAYNKINQK